MPSPVPIIDCKHFLSLQKAKEKEHVILDVRDTAEFEAGHIVGSLHTPRKELEKNILTLIPDKSAKVVVIVGPTQEPDIERIYETLASLGYANVEFLAGGIDRYCELASVEIEPELLERTPEESGAVGDELTKIDPESTDNEQLF